MPGYLANATGPRANLGIGLDVSVTLRDYNTARRVGQRDAAEREHPDWFC